ncbi:hypothetical protein Tco_1319799 [Tanacetum coccineum]
MSPPPSHEPENQASRNKSETKQTLGTAILQLREKVKKLENKLRKKRKRKETEDAEGQNQEVPSQTDQENTFATPEKSKGSGELRRTNNPSTIKRLHKSLSMYLSTRVQRRKGKEPMTEEDLQAEVQASKKSKELQELADLEEAQRVQAKMDAETQRQIDLDALLAKVLLVMEEYKDKLPEGFDRMLWGDLMIMFNQGDTADFWDTQQNWKLISWKLHSSSGIPLTRSTFQQMLEIEARNLKKKLYGCGADQV